MIALAVYVDQSILYFFELFDWHKDSIYISFSCSLLRNVSLYKNFFFTIRRKIAQFTLILSMIENSLYRSFFFSCPDHFSRAFFTQDKSYSVDDDGFSSTCFSCEYGKAFFKVQCDIFYCS